MFFINILSVHINFWQTKNTFCTLYREIGQTDSREMKSCCLRLSVMWRYQCWRAWLWWPRPFSARSLALSLSFSVSTTRGGSVCPSGIRWTSWRRESVTSITQPCICIKNNPNFPNVMMPKNINKNFPKVFSQNKMTIFQILHMNQALMNSSE